MVFRFRNPEKLAMVAPERALPGRDTEMPVPPAHFVLGHELRGPYPDGLETAMFVLGCFWGAERIFWQLDGVYTTAVGYAAGFTPNPSYEEVCSGRTGHTEAVLVVFDPEVVGYDELLRVFWEGHDPTQGMQQGNDVGTQYRSGIYWYSDAQRDAAQASRAMFQARLTAAGYGEVTTELLPAPEFFFAEDYHQQYLAKNPGGYCGLGGTGVSCPIGVAGVDRAADASVGERPRVGYRARVAYSARQKLLAAARQNQWRIVGRKVLNRLQPEHRDQAEAWAAARAEPVEDFAGALAPELWAEADAWSTEFRADARARTESGVLGSVPMGGPGDYRLVYFLTRHLRPELVLETGVAAGYTSQAILVALERNGAGTLFSSDLPYMGSTEARQEVGRVVEPRLRAGWHLALGGDRANFAEFLPQIDRVDLLHYDSDKSAGGRKWALDALGTRLGADAVVVMDDIADNTFFRDWVTRTGRPHRVFHRGGRYYVGLVGL